MSTSAKNPISVKECAVAFGKILREIPPVWVEGEISQLNARPGSGVVYLTLRDLNEDYNIPLKMFTTYYKTLGTIKDNARVLVKLRPDFWANGGRMSFHVDEMHAVGEGNLYANLEALKNKLFEEGLFDPKLKLDIPFLPEVVGIICGRESDAKKDVVENAKRKWPAVKFEILEVAVQGTSAVMEVCKAFNKLNKDPQVSVIVITRGGGSFEDLLPFSDETLLRTVAQKTKPVISAIGHEKDQPLLDLIADWRASTPTDAGKKIVPDYLEQREIIKGFHRRLNNFVEGVISNEFERMANLQNRALKSLTHKVELNKSQVNSLLLQLRALSPQSTLERGYAIVENQAGAVIKSKKEVKTGETLRVIFAKDEIQATVTTSKDQKE